MAILVLDVLSFSSLVLCNGFFDGVLFDKLFELDRGVQPPAVVFYGT